MKKLLANVRTLEQELETLESYSDGIINKLKSVGIDVKLEIKLRKKLIKG